MVGLGVGVGTIRLSWSVTRGFSFFLNESLIVSAPGGELTKITD